MRMWIVMWLLVIIIIVRVSTRNPGWVIHVFRTEDALLVVVWVTSRDGWVVAAGCGESTAAATTVSVSSSEVRSVMIIIIPVIAVVVIV